MSTASPSPSAANSIGFLRFSLAMMVVYTHAYFLGGFGREPLALWSNGTIYCGTAAVQGFFVLSGALITSSWLRAGSTVRFFWHRFLRIAPAFWVCLIVTAFVLTPVMWLTSVGPRAPFFAIEPSSFEYVWRNFFRPRAQIAIGVFPNGGPYPGDWNGSLWTLFYECACYAMIGGIGLAGLLVRARKVGLTLLLMMLALHSLAVAFPGALPFFVARLFDTPGKHLTVYFFAGSAWALLPNATAALLRRRWVGPLASVLLVVSWHWSFHAWLAVGLMPIALFWLAETLPLQNFERLVGGDYSYGIYIYGYPVQQTLTHFGAHSFGLWPFLLASFFCTGVFAIGSWRVIERPALSLKNVFRKTAPNLPRGSSASVAPSFTPP
jgi:peptidoglycan/LPS O-acetylase OafA/YrhL